MLANSMEAQRRFNGMRRSMPAASNRRVAVEGIAMVLGRKIRYRGGPTNYLVVAGTVPTVSVIAVKKGHGAMSRLLQTSPPPVSENSPLTRWTNCSCALYTPTRISKSLISFSLYSIYFFSIL